MKSKTLISVLMLALILALLAAPMVALAGNGGNGKDKSDSWVKYMHHKVKWTCSGGTCSPEACPDRDLDGNYGENAIVEVDYGRYTDFFIEVYGYPDEDNDGLLERMEEACVTLDPWDTPTYDHEVIHLEMNPVAEFVGYEGSVPGGVIRFVIKDKDGDGEYVGAFTSPYDLPGLTVPDGPFLLSLKTDYHEFVDGSGLVTGGYQMQYHYFRVPGW